MASNKLEIRSLLLSQGWTEDRFGNLKGKSGTVRIKFQATSMRVEKKVTYKPIELFGGQAYQAPPEWKNIVSDYYKNIEIRDGHVCIGGYRLKEQKAA